VVQLQNGGEQRGGFDAHEHDAVAQPFGDAHPTPGADLAQKGTERSEDLHRVLVPLTLGQGRETRDVDEGEASMDPHPGIVPRFRAWTQSLAVMTDLCWSGATNVTWEGEEGERGEEHGGQDHSGRNHGGWEHGPG
jgi:hypothetical protein